MEDRARTYHRARLILGAANLAVTAGVLGRAAWATPHRLRRPAGAGHADLALAIESSWSSWAWP